MASTSKGGARLKVPERSSDSKARALKGSDTDSDSDDNTKGSRGIHPDASPGGFEGQRKGSDVPGKQCWFVKAEKGILCERYV